MNEHDDLGPGRDVLKQTINALVDGATPSGEPSAPETNLGSLRRRVRTWRVAKAGAMGLGSMAVVAALAFSTAQATTWERSEPLPGRPTVNSTDTGPTPSELPTSRRSPSPTVSASPSPSASPSDVPDAEPSPDVSSSSVATDPEPDGSEEPDAPESVWPPFEPFDEGYLSWAFEAPPIGCGMPAGDLPTDPVRFTIEPNDSPADLRVTSGFTVTEVAGESHEIATGGDPEFLLFQDGRLVSSSVGQRDAAWWGQDGQGLEEREDEDGNTVTYEATAPGQTWQIGTHPFEVSDISTCGAKEEDPGWPSAEFSTPLPAGQYEVVYAAPYQLVDSDSWELAYSDFYPVTLP